MTAVPKLGNDMEETFDQLFVRIQRRLNVQGDVVEEDDVSSEELEIHHHSLRSIVLTSWAEGEGTSTVAVGLAARAASAGQGDVCLVDANFHHASLSASAQLDDAPGLSDVMSDGVDLSSTLRHGPARGFYFLPAGRRRQPPPPSTDQNLQRVISELEERFRYVFFDTPCLKSGIDAYRWGRFVVNTVLVVRAGSAKRQTVAHAVHSLKLHGLSLLGIILNRRLDAIPNWLYPYL